MSYTCFDVSLEDKIAHIRLSRPEAYNSMVPEFWRELPEIVRTIDDAGEARAIVLSSTGKHFTAGMDLAVFTAPGSATDREGELGRRRANLRREILHLQETFSCLDRARMPVLAAVQGGCIGGGVDMISACDMRYCSADAFFCIQEVNIGMTADVGTFPRLPHLIPQGLVRELAYTGRRLTAREALDVGLVNRVFPTHDELVAGVLDGGARDRGAVAARGVGQQGDAQLRARSLDRRRARLHRHLADRHVPAGRHARGVQGEVGIAQAVLSRPAPGEEQALIHEQPVGDPRSEQLRGARGRVLFADRRGEAVAELGEVLAGAHAFERTALLAGDARETHAIVAAPDADRGRLGGERGRLGPDRVLAFALEALARDLHGEVALEQLEGGREREAQRREVFGRDRFERGAREHGCVGRGERARDRPFEPREIGGPGAAAREDLRERRRREVLGQARPGAMQRRPLGWMDHQIGLHEIVERVGPERARECAEVLQETVVDPGEVRVRIDPEPLARRPVRVAAQQCGELAIARGRLDSARRRDEAPELFLQRAERARLRLHPPAPLAPLARGSLSRARPRL